MILNFYRQCSHVGIYFHYENERLINFYFRDFLVKNTNYGIRLTDLKNNVDYELEKTSDRIRIKPIESKNCSSPLQNLKVFDYQVNQSGFTLTQLKNNALILQDLTIEPRHNILNFSHKYYDSEAIKFLEKEEKIINDICDREQLKEKIAKAFLLPDYYLFIQDHSAYWGVETPTYETTLAGKDYQKKLIYVLQQDDEIKKHFLND